jgi:glycerophosphoryl diester phosphodiesterase
VTGWVRRRRGAPPCAARRRAPALAPRLAAVLLALAAGCAPALPRLAGHALLPAATFAAGPTSGQWIGAGPINGQDVPFVDRQPVQGFSAMLVEPDGTLLALSDNGFGTVEASADYHLRLYRLAVDFATAAGGTGRVDVLGWIELSDPDGHVPFLVVNGHTHERVLTGADFDVESLRRAPDGTLWIGDELGPFLLHADAEGRLLAPPVELPDPDGDGALRSPQSPRLEEASVLRLMQAHRAHAAASGAPAPTLSPHHLLVADGDRETAVAARRGGGAGEPAVSSELVDVASLHRAGFRVVPWTVNEPERMRRLLSLGVDGLITDRPDLLREVLEAWDEDGDGRPDLLDDDGLVDRSRFDAQGHRGARGLRPENTLPAFEAALDQLVSTIETDLGLTADAVPVLNHEPWIDQRRCRRRGEPPGAGGAGDGRADPLLLHDATAAELRDGWVCDGLLAERFPEQAAAGGGDAPVAAAFAEARGLADLHALPDLAALFEFVAFYERWYGSGPGVANPGAARRALSAARVRFNLELKRDPTAPELTADAATFVRAVAAVIDAAGAADRVEVQSFDHAALRAVHRAAPHLDTTFLVDDATLRTGEDGRAPWLGGLPWPYRATASGLPVRVAPSGGLEGLALTTDGWHLLPMLEKPIAGDRAGALRIFELDLAAERFTGATWLFPQHDGATAIGDFVMVDARRGLVIERDDAEADVHALKLITELTLGAPGAVAATRTLVDLVRLPDPDGIAGPAAVGDVGLGTLFSLPFFTIECLAVLDARRILVANDNNYPFGLGRHAGSGRPDDNEIIVVALPEALY